MAKSIAEIDREMERLKALRKAQVAKERAAERKRRNHALMTAGGLLEGCFDGGWAEVGYGKLASYLKRHKDEIVAECRVERLEGENAYKRLRDWERAGRAAAKEGAEAPAETTALIDFFKA